MKKLPVGIQHFPFLIRDDYLYVDKTKLIYDMIQGGRGHFLARPRRFGKSLLLSTLASIFQGEQELFNGTWIHSSNYEWEKYPVLTFDFSTLSGDSKLALEESLHRALENVAEDLGLTIQRGPRPADTFISLIRLVAKEKELVILIDEYDHPLVSQFGEGNHLEEMRKVMHDFFIVIKSLGKYVRYAFLTGVSKFSKVSLFSGMNNLIDLTLNAKFSTIAGISEEEIDQHYSEWIQEVAKKRNSSISDTRALMRKWYNGYLFSGATEAQKVYNPVSLHLFINEARLANYWFGTATPTFAIRLIQKQDYPIMDFENGVKVGGTLEEHHEVSSPNLIPLLFQTGYLTITNYDEASSTYHLAFPNEEVKRSFLEHLLKQFTKLNDSELRVHHDILKTSLLKQNWKEFFQELNRLLSEIPYTLHIPFEAYYHSLFYLLLRTLDFSADAEVLTSRGRLDLMITLDDMIYLIEFKINASAKKALEQIKSKHYADRFISENRKVFLIGVNIDSHSKQIEDWTIEPNISK